MGNLFTKSSESNQIISNAENDYNPFNIPSIELNQPGEFNSMVAIKGCPPFNNYTKAQFANLPIKIKAAYADGVVRGSYQKEWLQEQFKSIDLYMDTNDSAVGALAYYYLKTNDLNILNKLTEWNYINRDNHNKFT